MVTWTPVQKRHAIERMRFEVAFTEGLPARAVEAARRAFDQMRSDLRLSEPKVLDLHQIVLQPGGEPHQSSGTKVAGWQSIKQREGLVLEAISLTANGLLYESSDYRSWDTASRRFLTVAAKVIAQVSEVVDFRSFSHDYTDRFIFHGAPQSANPGEILQPDLLAPLNEGARSGKFLWHVHRGWFDEMKDRSILMNQNFDAQDGKTPTGTNVRSVQIFTRAEFRPRSGQFRVDGLEELAHELHILCNDRFYAALTEHARNMIGMTGRDSQGV